MAEIWVYLAAEASKTLATQWLGAIERKIDPLLRLPLMGSPRQQFAAGLRVIFHSPYAIYYLHTEGELVIVRVLHSARDAAAIAEQGGFKS